MKLLIATIFCIAHCFFYCAQKTDQMLETESLSFLALGDSYTIGEAVPERDRWPEQLVTRLRERGIPILKPKIIATTGWTTDELMKAVAEADPKPEYDLVSLLIGVNNQYRGYQISDYEREFTQLLDQAIHFAKGKSTNVFVLSIPDYGVTKFSKDKNLDSKKIAREIDEYNAVAKRISESREVQFFDITDYSKKAAHDLNLVANDDLHPSGKMYQNWVDTCFEWVLRNVKGG